MSNKMKMQNIKDLMENMQEVPSGHCWKAIEQQLSVMMPASSSVQGSASGQPAASGVKGALMQKSAAFWVKAAAITASSIAVTAIAVITIVNMTKQETPATQPNQPAIENTNATAITDTLTILPEEEALLPNNQTGKTDNPEISNTNDIPVVEKSTSEEQMATQQPLSAAVPTVVQTNSTTSQINSPSSTSKPEKNSDGNSSQPPIDRTQKSLPQNIAHDPVLQNRANQEKLDFSTPLILEIPNVITPNGDGYNDYFVINGIEQCEKSRLIIRNKSGRVIFQSNHYENNWGADGIEPGTYYYQFYYSINNIEEVCTGSLMIIK